MKRTLKERDGINPEDAECKACDKVVVRDKDFQSRRCYKHDLEFRGIVVPKNFSV